MKDKLISLVMWIIIWWSIVYSYWYLTSDSSWRDTSKSGKIWISSDTSNMSDEQLERMATRAWISEDELKKRIEAWENPRDIMWTSWGAKNWTWSNTK